MDRFYPNGISALTVISSKLADSSICNLQSELLTQAISVVFLREALSTNRQVSGGTLSTKSGSCSFLLVIESPSLFNFSTVNNCGFQIVAADFSMFDRAFKTLPSNSYACKFGTKNNTP